MTLVIGLTGGIASGKSTISLMFDDLNIPVIDADKIAREVVVPGKEAYKKIVRTFGEETLRDDRTLDRPKLGAIVFSDEAKRQQLNEVIHPAIRKEMFKQRDHYVNEDVKSVVLDIPLLFEGKNTYDMDRTIVVYVNENVQLKRLMKRNDYTEEEAKQRIAAQMPVGEKAKQADAVIDNNGTKYESFEQLEKILREWNVI